MAEQKKLLATLQKYKKSEKDLIILNSDIYAKKIKELDTGLKKVAWLLEKFSHLRECDRCLIFYYYNYVDGMEFQLNSDMIHNLSSSETIRRVRQLIQNEYKLFLPVSDVEEARNICENAVKDWVIDSKI